MLRGSNGIRLVGDAFGDPSQPPVILLHGGGQTRHAWGATAQDLARQGWYALALDQRGHGESDWAPDGDYRYEAFCADLEVVLAQLERPPALVGASLGGIVALLTEARAPHRALSCIVLVDIAARMEADGIDRIIGFMRAHLDGFETVDEAAAAVAEYLPHRPRPSDHSGLVKNLRLGDDGRYRWHWDPAFVLNERSVTHTRNPDLLPAARTLTIPVLLVRGRMSEILSEAGAAEFLAAVPHASYVDVSGAGHMVAGDRNDVFSEAVIAFLERLRREQPSLFGEGVMGHGS